MIDLMIETLAKMYDAIMRGVCFAITLAITWVVIFPVVKYTPRFLKSLGVW